jgi:hypothetical protein
VLAEAVSCGISILNVNGGTPCKAVYGRVPSLHPSIAQVYSPHETTQPSPGLIRHTHRLREIGNQAMVDGSARARLGHAMNPRTTIAAQSLNPQAGDEVGLFKPTSTKDTS